MDPLSLASLSPAAPGFLSRPDVGLSSQPDINDFGGHYTAPFPGRGLHSKESTTIAFFHGVLSGSSRALCLCGQYGSVPDFPTSLKRICTTTVHPLARGLHTRIASGETGERSFVRADPKYEMSIFFPWRGCAHMCAFHWFCTTTTTGKQLAYATTASSTVWLASHHRDYRGQGPSDKRHRKSHEGPADPQAIQPTPRMFKVLLQPQKPLGIRLLQNGSRKAAAKRIKAPK